MTGATINVTDTDVIDSSYAAIHFVSGTTSGVHFDGVRIRGAGTFALQLNDPATATFADVTATGLGFAEPVYSCLGQNFHYTLLGGNSGWQENLPRTYCGAWPPPVYDDGGGDPDPTGPRIAVSPSTLDFGGQPVGTTSAGRTVTVTNPGDATASVSSVTATGDFARTTTCGASLAPGASCTATVTFTPTAAGTRTGTLTVASDAPGSPHTVALSGDGTGGDGANLALHRPVTASSHTDVYWEGNAVDGNAGTYWESANHAFPQSLTVDLQTVATVDRVVLKLPPPSVWGARTQTIEVLGSVDGSSYTTLAGAAGYRFDPATGNTVTITVPASDVRWVRLVFTANTGWPAGQCGEFEVYGTS